MKVSVDIGGPVDSEKERQERLKVERQKRDKKAARHKKWVFLQRVLTILFWRIVYKKKYRHYEPSWDELRVELDTPEKAFAWFSEFVDVINAKNLGDEIKTPKEVLKMKKATDKTMAYVYADLLHRHGFQTAVMWVGYKQDYMYPFCSVIEKVYTLSLGATYKVHWGDQFDIMRDYFKDGTTWKVMDWTGTRLIMSYIFGRSGYGSPDILIYDEKYWGQNQPLAFEIASKLRLMKPSTEGEIS